MVEIWEREFADSKVPVGMAGPLDVEIVSIIERELDFLVLEVVDDGAVIYTVDGDLAAFSLVKEAVALLAEFCDVDGGDVELVLVDVKVGEGFLVVGVDLEEDYVFGIVFADDDLAEELPVGLFGESAEMSLKGAIEVVGFDVLAGEEILITEDGGEGLELDQFWTERTVGVSHETEVDGHEVGLWIFVGDAEPIGDGGVRGLHVGGIVEELVGEIGAAVGEFLEKRWREEAGSFGDAEFNVGASEGIEAGEKIRVGLRGEVRVELIAIGLQHGS